MKGTIIVFCLIGAVFANPISYSTVSESNELDLNSTESMLIVSQSAENDTSEIQSSEETTSSQSQSQSSESESESVETTSEDKTSEESNSQSEEDNSQSEESDSQSDESNSQSNESDSMGETRDDSMGSEENIRKSWARVFESVIKVHSAEDNSSTEVKSQSEELTGTLPTQTSSTGVAAQGQPNLPLVENQTDSSDTTSESADTSEVIGATASTTSDSSESTSSESNETSEASDDSSDASKSTEDSNASDSTELGQIKSPDCVNGTQSCESEEYFFQDIGDDAHHHSVDNLMVPDDDERELSLRRR